MKRNPNKKRRASGRQRALRSAVAMAILGLVLVIGSVTVLATTATSPTAPPSPSASQTVRPTATPDPNATPEPSPTVSFDSMETFLPTEEEFFGTDHRNDIADYDNPAYTADDSDDPIVSEEDGVVSRYLGELFRDNAATMDIVVFLTLLGLVPSLIIMLTGFTRIVIVLSFVRNAMGTNNMPPNMVIIGLALFLTFFVMYPIFAEIEEVALTPYLEGEILIEEAAELAIVPLRDFMLRNTYTDDLEMFIRYSGIDTTDLELADVPTHVIIPAFMTSEIKTAFLMGFFIYIPFIVIDMVVASTLMSMGMMMLPPVMISLPFKVLLFVSVNGWQMVISTLIGGFK